MTEKVYWYHAESDCLGVEESRELFEQVRASEPLVEEISEERYLELLAKFEEAKQKILFEWWASLALVAEAKLVIENEQALRKKVVAMFFQAPAEGVNKAGLQNGYTLKYTHKIDRKVDESVLPAIKEKLREMQINPDPLINYEPKLDTKQYRALVEINPEAARIFEGALTIKPGSPVLEIVPPKEKK